jgi:hypothetical protein
MTQHFPDEDPRNDAAREHYDRTRNQILLETLEKARQGTLAESWRADLQPPEYGMPADRIYTDADMLAIEEIRHMDVAAWEPGQVAGWRHALDAWYLAYRGVLIEYTVSTDRNFGRILQTRTQTLTTKYLGILRSSPALTSTLADEVRGTLSDLDGNMDRSRRQFDDSYIVQRDRLGASYLAGLAAGGDDNDWVQWLQARITAWNNSQAAEATRAQLEKPEFRTEMQRLPTYWAGE